MDGPAGVFARESDALRRAVEVGVAGGRVVSVDFPATVSDDAAGESATLDRLFAYLGGTEERLTDVEVALTVPTDHRDVLEATRNVPYGETVAASRVARMTGLDADDADDLATVREALANNPVPILVPDHRVSGVSGATPDSVGRRLRVLEE